MSQKEDLCSEPVFRAVFDAHFKLLRHYLMFRFRNVERADDLAQNAFVALWKNCAGLQSIQARSFLFTTATRLALNEIRHDKVVERFGLENKPNGQHSETPERLYVQQELRTRLDAAIARLPEKQRLVFTLNRFENLSYAEIADLLALSVKAVEKRMHLALVELREAMKDTR